MNRSDRTSSWPARALAVLLVLTQPVLADTVCVNTVDEFLDAHESAGNEERTINVVAGAYDFPFYAQDEMGGSLDSDFAIVGGWNGDCSVRQLDPRLTVFTGALNGLSISSWDTSIRLDSLTFTVFGQLGISSIAGGNIHLERVWFNDIHDSATTPVSVVLSGAEVRLSHVVATSNVYAHCAVNINTVQLQRASVSHSLFTGNNGQGLCVHHPAGGESEGVDDFELSISNSIFWNNAQEDIVTRDSPHLSLKNNIYQSTDLSPGPDTTPVQNLNVDPQFQNAAARDFRLQASSPAVDSGRFALQLAQEYDLVGGWRVLGDAPDRGPFEFNPGESPLVVENTLDNLAPVATGSLRWAIEQANARPGLDRIRFALPDCPRLIDLQDELPDITESVFIDGYSQPGSERNASQRGFNPTLCVGVRDPSLSLDHALRIPAGAADDTLLWVSGLAFGGFDLAAVRIAAGSNTWVFGNQFGGSLGATALGNNAVNVRLGGTSHDNLVGGLETSQRNLIGSAYVAGVELLDNGSGAEGHDNSVRNNLIGLDGDDARPNALGVRVRTHRNRIEDNYISGNQGDGVLIEGDLAFHNDIRDNAIGLKTFAFCLPPCTPDYALGNAGAGVRLVGGGDDNAIKFNRIRHNGGAGVRLEDGLRNLLFSNSISANGALGIDLGTPGVNPVYNSGLAVTGTYANRGLNAPMLTAASGSGSGGRVAGQLASHNGPHLVEIFRNASCDASGRGEGLQSLTAGVVTISNAPIGDNGTASFDFELPSNVALDGATLSAVVNDGDDNTSEFSACLAYETVLCREIFRDGFEDNPPPLACTPL